MHILGRQIETFPFSKNLRRGSLGTHHGCILPLPSCSIALLELHSNVDVNIFRTHVRRLCVEQRLWISFVFHSRFIHTDNRGSLKHRSTLVGAQEEYEMGNGHFA